MKTLTSISIAIFFALLLFGNAAHAESPAKINYEKGMKFAKEGKFEQAVEEFEKIPTTDRLNYTAQKNLRKIKDVPEQKIKKETAIHLFTAKSYQAKERWDKALSEYDKAIEIDPEYDISYIGRGSVHLYKGIVYAGSHFKLAASDFNKAIKINPENAGAYHNRGITMGYLKQYERAISDYSKALELDPDNPSTYNNRGWLYEETGQYEQAVSDLTSLIELNPENADSYNNRARLFIAIKQYDKALDDAKKAKELGSPHHELIEELRDLTGRYE